MLPLADKHKQDLLASRDFIKNTDALFSLEIETPRDANRLLNSLSVTWPAVEDECYFPDFLTIEFLRIFQPKLYDAIRTRRDVFCGKYSLETQHNQSELNEIFPENRHKYNEIIRKLFKSSYENYSHFSTEEKINRRWYERRISSYFYFPIYFKLFVPPQTLSAARVRELTTALKTPKTLLTLLEEDPSFPTILDTLHSVIMNLAGEDTKTAIRNILSVTDCTISERINNEECKNLHYIAASCSTTIKDKDERSKFLSEIIINSDYALIIMHINLEFNLLLSINSLDFDSLILNEECIMNIMRQFQVKYLVKYNDTPMNIDLIDECLDITRLIIQHIDGINYLSDSEFSKEIRNFEKFLTEQHEKAAGESAP